MKFDSEKSLFVFDREKWKEICETDYCLADKPTVAEIENGIILPLRKRTDLQSVDACFEGGVCDRDGNFIAGNRRSLKKDTLNLSCTKAYPIEQALKVRHETVVYCGVLMWHFGHVFSDGFSRLWWYADHPETEYKLVFLEAPVYGGFKYYNMLEAAGIKRDRMEFISEPTQFDKIIVPDETLYMWSNYRPGAEKIYGLIRDRVTPKPYKRIYLSRTAYEEQDLFNEEYFENFYARRGYEIIHPEKLPFEEQISVMAGAEEVVSTSGTLAMLAMFCHPGTRLIYLTRCADKQASELICLQSTGIDYTVVDVYMGFLPATHVGHSIFFVGPTEYWKQYLDKADIAYEPDEVSFDLHVKPVVYDYIVKWGEHNADPAMYRSIRNKSLVDVVQFINILFRQTNIDRKVMPDRDGVVKLKKSETALKKQCDELKGNSRELSAQNMELLGRNGELIAENKGLQAQCDGLTKEKERLISQTEELLRQNSSLIALSSETARSTIELKKYINSQKREVKRLKKQVAEMKASTSWRITKPFRALAFWLKRLFKLR